MPVARDKGQDMAEAHFAGRDDGILAPVGAPVQRLVNLAGAAISVGLIVGLCLWGYRLAVRDVTGVPVVRAMEGPMRVAPENPGGEVMAHQGLAVNEVAEDGVAAGLAERVVLAPRPVDLTAEDAAGSFATPDGPTSARADATAGLTLAASAEAVPEAPPQDTASLIDAVVLSVVADGDASVEAGVTAAEDVAGDLDASPEAAVVTPAALPGRADGPSLRPLPRPARLARTDIPAPAPAAITAALPEIDPATLAAGTRLVQLGAFDTAEEARAEWGKLYARFGDLMRDKAPVVEPAQSGGRAFFRLRANGFGEEEDARRFCAALLAEEAACIPVAQR